MSTQSDGKGQFFFQRAHSPGACVTHFYQPRTLKSARGSKGWANVIPGASLQHRAGTDPKGKFGSAANAADSLLAGTDEEGKVLLADSHWPAAP